MSDHAKSGFPGKLQAARTHAPDDAGESEIQDVADEAHQRDCDAVTVWRERRNNGLQEFGGGQR